MYLFAKADKFIVHVQVHVHMCKPRKLQSDIWNAEKHVLDNCMGQWILLTMLTALCWTDLRSWKQHYETSYVQKNVGLFLILLKDL